LIELFSSPLNRFLLYFYTPYYLVYSGIIIVPEFFFSFSLYSLCPTIGIGAFVVDTGIFTEFKAEGSLLS
jgi:hypothetical protein